ncbi:MFS transporter [uncultured Winogradskyella sp.]|uniref:MDR family MFS transporter n=1 Tax=uncultured Winogradskyella sp. TaxID=395353 RepID=UPI002639F480|nr:MFS transporter [uncultured Winogradskyella sp.]
MKTLFKNYLNTFNGLSREVWWLALITFINRSGTMVIPFLTLYLNEDLSFSFPQVGWIMSCFGLGSVVGTWLGGKLTDQIGYYKVMVRSLLSTGIVFIALQFLTSFTQVCIGIFLVMVVADTFRPAMFVAMSVYSKPENKTRSVTLIRLAINLGFSAGPAIGGLIISKLDYGGLFWVDGITCILATLLLIKVLNPRVAKPLDDEKTENPKSAYKDGPYWIFFLAMFLFAVIFMQYFSTMPLYYRNIHKLTELEIGLLLGLNGFLIFILEMPLIHWLDKRKYNKILLTSIGILLTVLSFVVINLTSWTGILIMSILLMTVGEMIGFPYSNAFAMDRSKRGKKGQYLAMYLMAFSLANVFGHNGGIQLIDKIGYDMTWNIMISSGLLGVLFLIYLKYRLKKEIT